MATLKSLTGGTHALPIRSNSPDKEEREGNPGVVFVTVDPVDVELTDRELRYCIASGKVEEVKAPAPPPPAPPSPPPPPQAKGGRKAPAADPDPGAGDPDPKT